MGNNTVPHLNGLIDFRVFVGGGRGECFSYIVGSVQN